VRFVASIRLGIGGAASTAIYREIIANHKDVFWHLLPDSSAFKITLSKSRFQNHTFKIQPSEFNPQNQTFKIKFSKSNLKRRA